MGEVRPFRFRQRVEIDRPTEVDDLKHRVLALELIVEALLKERQQRLADAAELRSST